MKFKRGDVCATSRGKIITIAKVSTEPGDRMPYLAGHGKWYAENQLELMPKVTENMARSWWRSIKDDTSPKAMEDKNQIHKLVEFDQHGPIEWDMIKILFKEEILNYYKKKNG